MTENDAYHAVGLLIGGVRGWPDSATDGFVEAFQKHVTDTEAMLEVCEHIALSWGDRDFRPSIGEVLDAYRKHPRVAAEREARVAAELAKTATATHCTGTGWVEIPGALGLRRPCPRCNPFLADIYEDQPRWERYLTGTPLHELHDAVTLTRGEQRSETPMPPPCKVETRYDPERLVDFAEGMQIARDEFRSVYGREMGDTAVANPAWAITLIESDEHHDERLDLWYSTYPTVLAGFRGDHAAAIASLNAIDPRRLTWDGRGRLTLKPPPETPTTSPEPRKRLPAVVTPPQPADDPVDVTGLMRDAIEATAGKMTDDAT